MEDTQYRCQAVHPFTCKAMVFTGLIIDARLDERILRNTTAELVKAWPVLGGQLYRTVSEGHGFPPQSPKANRRWLVGPTLGIVHRLDRRL